jgi:hypothetical protein
VSEESLKALAEREKRVKDALRDPDEAMVDFTKEYGVY